MNDAGRAVNAPTISSADAVAEAACDNGRRILAFRREQLIAACGLALMGIAVLVGSNYSLSIAKGDFRLICALRARRCAHAEATTAVVGRGVVDA